MARVRRVQKGEKKGANVCGSDPDGQQQLPDKNKNETDNFKNVTGGDQFNKKPGAKENERKKPSWLVENGTKRDHQ